MLDNVTIGYKSVTDLIWCIADTYVEIWKFSLDKVTNGDVKFSLFWAISCYWACVKCMVEILTFPEPFLLVQLPFGGPSPPR